MHTLSFQPSSITKCTWGFILSYLGNRGAYRIKKKYLGSSYLLKLGQFHFQSYSTCLFKNSSNNNKKQNYQHLGEFCAMRSSWQGGPTPLCSCNDLMLITWGPSSTLCSASSFAELMMQSSTVRGDRQIEAQGSMVQQRLHTDLLCPGTVLREFHGSLQETRNPLPPSFSTDSMGAVNKRG